jgi:hypothetical protein
MGYASGEPYTTMPASPRPRVSKRLTASVFREPEVEGSTNAAGASTISAFYPVIKKNQNLEAVSMGRGRSCHRCDRICGVPATRRGGKRATQENFAVKPSNSIGGRRFRAYRAMIRPSHRRRQPGVGRWGASDPVMPGDRALTSLPHGVRLFRMLPTFPGRHLRIRVCPLRHRRIRALSRSGFAAKLKIDRDDRSRAWRGQVTAVRQLGLDGWLTGPVRGCCVPAAQRGDR